MEAQAASRCCGACEPDVDLLALDRLIDEDYRGDPENLIMIMQAVQKKYNYLPEAALRYIGGKLGVALTYIYGVASFYSSFSLTPKGKHIIHVCTGTACHLRGSDRVVVDLCDKLNIQPGETTADGLFTLETVNCVGACAVAMVAVVDEKYLPRASFQDIEAFIDEKAQGQGE